MQRNLLNNLFLSFLFVYVIAISCSVVTPLKNKESKTKSLSYNKLIKSINEHQFLYDWIRLKGDAAVVFKGEEQKIKTNFRMRNDSVVWMNFSKSSFQLLTGLIGKDSIKTLIKYPEKKYFSGTYEELKNVIGVDLSYKLIENVLIGRAIGLEKNKKNSVGINDNHYYIEIKNSSSTEKDFISKYWINSNSFKCDSIAINTMDNETKMNISYNNWIRIEKQYFPMNVNFNYTSISDTISLELKYKSPIKINEKQRFPFKKTDKYTPLIFE